MARVPPACPRCRSSKVAPIAFPWPTADAVEPFLAAVYNDAILPGGSSIPDNAPAWRCRACGHEWSADTPVARVA